MRHRVPKGFARTYVAPKSQQSPRLRLGIALLAAIGAHGAILALALTRSEAPPTPPAKKELPIVVATRPPPPPEPEEPPPPKVHTPSPPAAAQTAKVIARAESAAPADLTDFAIVTGKSETFAGGYSASAGTGKTAVSNPQASAKPEPPSHARSAAPARRDWSCSWPSDAEESDLKEAFVTISVTIDDNGSATQVDISKSPAATFAEAARNCALAERYEVALDRDGHRIAAQTPHFVVHFFR
jgi:protein TonB